jgi:predicted secreted hydrolase
MNSRAGNSRPGKGRAGALAGLLSLALATCTEPMPPDAQIDLGAVLGGDAGDFQQALKPRPFEFPEDHGSHPGFRSEWWYLTGRLDTRRARSFGFQLTFFRFALPPQSSAPESAWATEQIYLAHFAITDVEGEKHHAFERFTRGGNMLLAGVGADPLRVWLDDWWLKIGTAEDPGWGISARETGVALALNLQPLKPVVAQGEAGLSRKTATPGNASYYYSIPRMSARGTLQIGTDTFAVDGTAWLDREWSTSSLGDTLAGWQWLGLQLVDGRDFMSYRLRRVDGSAHLYDYAVFIASDGSTERVDAQNLNPREIRLCRVESGRQYPCEYSFDLPGYGTVRILPRLRDQEIDQSLSYWEGLVDAVDSREVVIGSGYLELTGYSR